MLLGANRRAKGDELEAKVLLWLPSSIGYRPTCIFISGLMAHKTRAALTAAN
jgi:hypothetical protein